MRSATINRDTTETKVSVFVSLDGAGTSEVDTGLGFLDHMLALLAKHGGLDLKVNCKGDLNVDGHHSVEDIGITIGKAISASLGDKRGICRYGSARIPMDEALVTVDLDLSGRSYIVFNAMLKSWKCGDFETALTEEFFRALAFNSGMTLHLNCLYGSNDHHIIEGMFKAFGRALRQAISVDIRFMDEIPSTKGIL